MAGVFEESISDDLLTCPICFDYFQNPKILPCHHTFCANCIQRHLQVYQRRRNAVPGKIPCPNCRHLATIPKGGVIAFPNDFKITKIKSLVGRLTGELQKSRLVLCVVCLNNGDESEAQFFCLECMKYFCTPCAQVHETARVFEHHHVQELPLHIDEKLHNACGMHVREPLKHYCRSCNKEICDICAITNHLEHQVANMDTKLQRARREQQLQVAATKLDKHIEETKETLQCLVESEDCMKTSYEEVCGHVHQQAEMMIEAIKMREMCVIQDLQERYVEKKTKLSNGMGQIKAYISHLTLIKILCMDIMNIKEFDIFDTASNGIIGTIHDDIKEWGGTTGAEASVDHCVLFEFTPADLDIQLGELKVSEQKTDTQVPALTPQIQDNSTSSSDTLDTVDSVDSGVENI